MLWKTHLAFAFLLGLALLPVLAPQNQILFMVIVLFASLLPDVDHPDSKIGKKVKVIAILFEHRGFFHSVFAIALLLLPFLLSGRDDLAWPLGIGYFSHLLIDALTVKGIMFFHPVSQWRVRGFVPAGSILEKAVFILLLLGIAWQLFSF